MCRAVVGVLFYYCHFFVGYLFIEYNVTLEKVCFCEALLISVFLNVQKRHFYFQCYGGMKLLDKFGEHFFLLRVFFNSFV